MGQYLNSFDLVHFRRLQTDGNVFENAEPFWRVTRL